MRLASFPGLGVAAAGWVAGGEVVADFGGDAVAVGKSAVGERRATTAGASLAALGLLPPGWRPNATKSMPPTMATGKSTWGRLSHAGSIGPGARLEAGGLRTLTIPP